MKKTIVMLLMLCILTMSVYAGSVSDLQYQDQTNIFGSTVTKTINDNNVKIDSDKLNGKTYNDISNDIETSSETVLLVANDYTKKTSTEIYNYVENKPDSVGWGWESVRDTLGINVQSNLDFKDKFGNFVNYLKSIFTTKSETQKLWEYAYKTRAICEHKEVTTVILEDNNPTFVTETNGVRCIQYGNDYYCKG